MKREDSDVIDLIARRNKYVEKWKTIPLIFFKNYSKLHDEFVKEIDLKIEESKISDPIKANLNDKMDTEMINGLQVLPVDTFIFFIKNKLGNETLFKIKVDRENNALRSEFFTTGIVKGKQVASIVSVKVKLEIKEKGFETSLENIETMQQQGIDKDDLETLIGHGMSSLTCILYTINKVHETNLYPIEKTVNNFKRKFKHGKKKKIGKQRTIIYLSKLPVKYIGSKKLGGHHASPRYHQRIGHMHTMRHERFKDHPDYMKPIWRKPVWVGVKETIVDGVTYKVL